MQGEEQPRRSRHARLAYAVALIGAIFSAAITAGAAGPSGSPSERVFELLVLGWACVPYLITAVLCNFIPQPKLKSALLYGLLGYAIVDGLIRVRSLYFPTGSTDSLVVLFLPVWSPTIVVIVGGASAALASLLHRGSGSRP
jgi:hypothetical protein